MTSAEEKWELPAALRVTPENLADVEAWQREIARRVNSPFTSLSPLEHEIARARQLIEDHKLTLRGLDVIIKRGGTRGKHLRRLKAAQEARPIVAAQLAEAYASAGRFDLAAEHDPAQRELYLKIWQAVWSDDEDLCECEAHRGQGKNASFEVTQRFVLKDIFSLKHRQIVSLIKCAGCAHLNARPATPDILAQRAHRARARAIVAGMTPDDAARELRARNHTAEVLLK
jgi:hypothetical protein